MPSAWQRYITAKDKIIQSEWHILDAIEYDIVVESPVVALRDPLKKFLGSSDVRSPPEMEVGLPTAHVYVSVGVGVGVGVVHALLPLRTGVLVCWASREA